MTNTPERIPTTWTAADETFFRVTAAVFSPHFLAGAGVLLASYDDEPTSAAVVTAAQTPPSLTVQPPVSSAL